VRAGTDRVLADAPKRVALASNSSGAASAAPNSAMSAHAPSDGRHDGEMCNFPLDPARRKCWKVILKMKDGAGTGAWSKRFMGEGEHLHATLAADGTIRIALDGWSSRQNDAMTGAMHGHLADNRIDAAGRWSNGVRVDGHWTRAQ